MTKTQKLLNSYESICNEIVQVFAEKQGLDIDNIRGWVGDDIGGIIDVSDMYLNFSDILLDIKKESKKGLIIEWYWESVDRHTRQEQTINYNSYIMGLRYKDLKKL